MKLLLAATVIAASLGTAQAQSFREAIDLRNPIIYNQHENEIGVIHGITSRGDGKAAVVQLVHGGVLDLGYHEVAIPAQALRPRARGGWYTNLNTTELAQLEPFTRDGRRTFFWRSGVN